MRHRILAVGVLGVVLVMGVVVGRHELPATMLAESAPSAAGLDGFAEAVPPGSLIDMWDPVMGELGPYPSTFAELVAGPEAIVIGVMGAAQAEATIVDYPVWQLPPGVIYPTQSPGESDQEYTGGQTIPITRFEFTPTQVLLSDGSIPVGAPIPLQVTGHAADIPVNMVAELGWPIEGRQYMEFLYRNEDEDDGSFQGAWSESQAIILDDPSGVVMYPDGDPVPFAPGMTRGKFIDAVADAVEVFGRPELPDVGSVRPPISVPAPDDGDMVTLADYEVTFHESSDPIDGMPSGTDGRAARYRLVIRNDSAYPLESVQLKLVPSLAGTQSGFGFMAEGVGPDVEPGQALEFVRWIVEDRQGTGATQVALRITHDRATQAAASPNATMSIPDWFVDEMAIDPADPITVAPQAFDALTADPHGTVTAELQWRVSGPQAHGGGSFLRLSRGRW